MSTYLYLRCESHKPPLENDGESGQHLRDLEQIWSDLDNRDRIAAAWNDDMIPDDYFRRHTARFLAAHPHSKSGSLTNTDAPTTQTAPHKTRGNKHEH